MPAPASAACSRREFAHAYWLPRTPAALAEVQQLADVRLPELVQELVQRPVVAPDRDERSHAESLAARRCAGLSVRTSGT